MCEGKKARVVAEQARLLELPRARSCCSTEACKKPSLDGLWIYGLGPYYAVTLSQMPNVGNLRRLSETKISLLLYAMWIASLGAHGPLIHVFMRCTVCFVSLMLMFCTLRKLFSVQS